MNEELQMNFLLVAFDSLLVYTLLTLTLVGNKAVGVMKAGQTFTIEPMINAGTFTS